MLSLSFLFWATVVVALLSFWWQGDRVKSLALGHVYRHCKHQNLQLLDQTMVLKGVWPVRDESEKLAIRRRYTFEFTSTGEVRNLGTIELIGRKLLKLELEAHILPDEDNPLH
ncbi:MAG: DUF3301 domain-containing protein [Gammaproteobacteria bacterium]|jgi:hypothetical protein|nr:DUF3301 domain-containing protein [Gammaproteobacteria bacterium]|tara:strand:+ start:201 stop:539 length:339 start_codon:yes stop_codon:yes gene_type:complete